MKGTLLLLTFGLAGTMLSAPSPPARMETITVAGTRYFRLEDWARQERFELRWTVPREEVKLIGARGSLVFWADSRKMSFNGVSVWLAGPVVMRAGTVYLATVDLATTLTPLLHPVRGGSGSPIRSICLDAGHGGKDPGNREGTQNEKKYTLLLAQEVATRLRDSGFKVHLTRSADTFIEKSLRPEIARQRRVDLFVSLHFNSADGPGNASVKGIETYCLTPAHTSSTNVRAESGDTDARTGNRLDSKNVLLAYQLQRALVRRLGAEDRGVRRARFAVLSGAAMPAVLIEGGFMTHAGESRRIYNASYRREMAQAIVDGIVNFKGLVDVPGS